MPRRLLKLDIFLPSVNNIQQEATYKQEVVETPFLQQQQRPLPSAVANVTADPISRVSTAARYGANVGSEQSQSRRSSRGRLAEDYKNLMFKHTDLEQVRKE